MPRPVVRPAPLFAPAAPPAVPDDDDVFEPPLTRWVQDAKLFALAWAGGFLFFLAFLG